MVENGRRDCADTGDGYVHGRLVALLAPEVDPSPKRELVYAIAGALRLPNLCKLTLDDRFAEIGCMKSGEEASGSRQRGHEGSARTDIGMNARRAFSNVDDRRAVETPDRDGHHEPGFLGKSRHALNGFMEGVLPSQTTEAKLQGKRTKGIPTGFRPAAHRPFVLRTLRGHKFEHRK